MSLLEDLIAEHCPDGVRFTTLGSAITIRFGTRITKSKHTGTLYPVYGGGGESFRTDEYNREDDYVISRFAMSENCVRKVSGKFWMLDSGFTFEPADPSVDKDYIAYLLFNMQPEIYACSSQGAQKNLKTEEFRKFRIPLPPLPVQRAIVTILDRFTELEAQLEAQLETELDARRKQYDSYRDSLVTVRDQPGVRWVRMGDVGEFIRGRRFVKSDVVADGIGSIHYGEIYTHYGTWTTTTISHVRVDLAPRLRFAHPGDVIVAAVGETVDDVGKAVAWLGDGDVAVHDDCFVFRHSDALDPKFVSYYFQTSTLRSEKAKYVARAKVKRLSGNSLGKLAIPLPPLEDQQRIAGILDSFDVLVSDLSLALPAELNARREQYEYYRAKLLSFTEAPQ